MKAQDILFCDAAIFSAAFHPAEIHLVFLSDLFYQRGKEAVRMMQAGFQAVCLVLPRM